MLSNILRQRYWRECGSTARINDFVDKLKHLDFILFAFQEVHIVTNYIPLDFLEVVTGRCWSLWYHTNAWTCLSGVRAMAILWVSNHENICLTIYAEHEKYYISVVIPHTYTCMSNTWKGCEINTIWIFCRFTRFTVWIDNLCCVSCWGLESKL